MRLIGENIHILSKKTREAIENRNKAYIQDLALRQVKAGIEWIDLNIGPARRSSEGVMNWLVDTILEVASPKFSFDTSNVIEVISGLVAVKNPQECIINSASGDPERLNNMAGVAARCQTYLIALTMNNEVGIPRDADGRMEIACFILDKTAELGIDNSKILFDPLVLPVSVDQTQILETLNSIRVFKESFDPPVSTIIGLSNASNGSPKELRPLINKILAVLAMGCGLDSAIVDAFDGELIRTIKVVETLTPEKEADNLVIGLYKMMQEFGELEDLTYNKDNPEEEAIYKTAGILLNKSIYAHNYLLC